MKTSAAIGLALLASVLVAVPASSHGNASSARSVTNPPAAALVPHGMFGPRQNVFFGYVRSVTRSGARYVMRVDPALVLSGLTATRAAVEAGAIAPGDPRVVAALETVRTATQSDRQALPWKLVGGLVLLGAIVICVNVLVAQARRRRVVG